MLAIIHTRDGDKLNNTPVTTVTLSHDPEDIHGLRIKMFHCINDGTPLGQYKGKVYAIHPGGPIVTTPWIQRCNTCKQKFAIQVLS